YDHPRATPGDISSCRVAAFGFTMHQRRMACVGHFRNRTIPGRCPGCGDAEIHYPNRMDAIPQTSMSSIIGRNAAKYESPGQRPGCGVAEIHYHGD
ncbi:MAG: hypothetical protein ACKN81_12650, partial [Pirellulaceae bacterium]